MSKESESKKKKQRKTYTITKPRESWTDEEHQRFLDALKLYDRDWKKIESYVKTKSVIQIRSHAQKYFMKMQKMGRDDLIPPPRPKRKADKPYPKVKVQGASKPKKLRKTGKKSSGKDASAFEKHSSNESYQSSSVSSNSHDEHPTQILPPSSLSVPTVTPALNWQMVEQQQHQQLEREQLQQAQYYLQQAMAAQAEVFQTQLEASGSNRQGHEFSKVYTFLGELFDPSTTGHMEKLQELSSVDRQIVQVLMHNLACNLSKHARQDPSWPQSVHNRVMALDEQITSFNQNEGKSGHASDSSSSFANIISMMDSNNSTIATTGSNLSINVNSLPSAIGSGMDSLTSPTGLHLHELPSPSTADMFNSSSFSEFGHSSSSLSGVSSAQTSSRSKNAADVLSTLRQSPR